MNTFQKQTKIFFSISPSLYKTQNTHKNLISYTPKNRLKNNIKTIFTTLFRHQQSANEDKITACDKIYTVKSNTTRTVSTIWTDKRPHNQSRILNPITYLHPEMNLSEINPYIHLYYVESDGQPTTNIVNYRNMLQETRIQVNQQTKELTHFSNNNKLRTNNLLIKKYSICGPNPALQRKTNLQ